MSAEDDLIAQYNPGRPISAYTVPYSFNDVGPDGVANTAERDALRALGGKLGLAADQLASAAAGAADVAVMKDGHRPDKYDFGALTTRLEERLPSLLRASKK